MPGSTEVAWFQLVMGLLGGLALFLYGMERMGESLKSVAGERMRSILRRLSTNRFAGLLTGAGVTAVIQSSSVTTVMLVGFVSANLMSLSQSVAVILGADIGTTITAQVVAFKVTKYALLFVAGGFFMLFFSKRASLKQWGSVIMGLGLIFFGMSIMSGAMKPLRDYQPFLEMMQGMSNPMQGILVAAVFTGLVQSSSATMGIIIVLAMQGLVSLHGGIALALGANIGTCVTAGLAAIGKPREAVRVAVTHVLFKVLGVVLLYPFIKPFAELVVAISPEPDATLTGQALMAQTVPRQIANAHTLFNTGLALLFLPATTQFARLVTWLVKDKPLSETVGIQNRYLDPILLKTPTLALDAVRHELARMGRRVFPMLEKILPAVLHGTEQEIADIAKRDDEVDQLYAQVMSYLGEVSRRPLSDEQTRELMRLAATANDLEAIGDIIETELANIGRRRITEGVTVSPQTSQRLKDYHKLVVNSLILSLAAITGVAPKAGADVVGMKSEVNELTRAIEAHQMQRLVADEPGRLAAYATEMDVLAKLRRVYYHAKRMAKTVT